MRVDYLTDPRTLQAVINVTQLYRDTTYSYPKSCPKYVIGYGPGNVQIIKGPCVYGGIRDLQASITSTVHNRYLSAYVFLISPESLNAFIGGHSPELLRGYIGGHFPNDMLANINGLLPSSFSTITARLISHNPVNITAYINPYEPVDLLSTISGHIPFNLQSYIATHQPNILSASLIGGYNEKLVDLYSTIGGHYSGNLLSYLGGHVPVDLTAEILIKKLAVEVNLGAVFEGGHPPGTVTAAVFVKQRHIYDLTASMYGYDIKNLTAFISTCHEENLSANISSIISKQLPAILKVWPQNLLTANTYGWQTSNLGAYVKRIYSSCINATLLGRYPLYENLNAMLKGVDFGFLNLEARIRPFYKGDLTSSVKIIYLDNLTSFLRAVAPYNLSGSLYSWAETFLHAEILGMVYPWNLTASIYGRDSLNNLTAIIKPYKATLVPAYLNASIQSWESYGLFACLSGDNSPVLSASLTPMGYSSDLHGSLIPKIIRLTTVMAVSTMEHHDLSAIINTSCFSTMYSTLTASIVMKYKSDLSSFVRAMSINQTPTTLSARVGFADSYSEVDKLKLCITLYPDEYITEDKFKMIFHILRSGYSLSAYINVIPNSVDLGASIRGEDIASFNFPGILKNRERVVDLTYSGSLKSYEVVEFAFKSIVEDYYYSSSGSTAWKSDRFDKWILDVKSYLPQNLTLQLKRRLHKATTLYDLRKFNSIDAAMRYVIDYVTMYPEDSLSASINSVGYYAGLAASVTPMYISSSYHSLSSTITSSTPTVILGTENEIIKI